MALAAVCFIALVSSFSLPQNSDDVQDYTNYHFTQLPVSDVPVPAYNSASRAPLENVVICPGEGVRCVVKVVYNNGYFIVNDEKGRDRSYVETIGSAN